MAFIGNQNDGANARQLNGVYRGQTVVMPSNVNAGDYSLWVRVDDSVVGDTFRGVIFASDGSTVVSYSDPRTDISTIGTQEFVGGTFASVPLVASTTYMIVVGCNSVANANAYFSDTPTAGYELTGVAGTVNNLTANPPTITGALAADAARPYTAYLEYTAAAGGATRHILILGVG
jgi:hypothetical protein